MLENRSAEDEVVQIDLRGRLLHLHQRMACTSGKDHVEIGEQSQDQEKDGPHDIDHRGDEVRTQLFRD